MKMIKLIPIVSIYAKPCAKKMYVKETNPYFKWYKENRSFKVVKEVEIA